MDIKKNKNSLVDKWAKKIDTSPNDISSSLYVELSESFSFRNLIDYLNNTNNDGTFVFSEEKICYIQSNCDNTITNIFMCDVSELTGYEISSNKNKITFRINMDELKIRTKSIQKKDKMVLCKNKNDPELYLYHYLSGTTQPMTYTIPTLTQEDIDFTLPDFTRPRNKPNSTITSGEFKLICSAMSGNKNKCKFVKIEGYERGIQFIGMSDTNNIIGIKKMGKLDDDLISYVDIQLSTIKYLARLVGLSVNGTIKFFIEKNKPLRIITNVGTYGEITVIVKSQI